MEVDDENNYCVEIIDRSHPLVVNNTEAVISKARTLYSERLMTDMILVVNEHSYPVHRIILIASSEYFQVMFHPRWYDSRAERIELTEEIGCMEVFEAFLKYLYVGQITLEMTSVIHLLMLCDKYIVKDLVNLCLKYMEDHIPAAAVEKSLVVWYNYCVNSNHPRVADMCLNYIKWNFGAMCETGSLQLFDAALLCSILKADDVVISSEYALFCNICTWIEYRKKALFCDGLSDEQFKASIVQVLALIRYPLMTNLELTKLHYHPVTKLYDADDTMAFTSTFLCGQGSDIEKNNCRYRTKVFTPRIYSAEAFSMILSVDDISTLNDYQRKTVVFSTALSISERCFAPDKQLDWFVDLFPKGVSFDKLLLIVWQGTKECPNHVHKTVRLSLHCKNEETVRVHITVLIMGMQNGVEHIRRVTRRPYIFSGVDRILNLDNLIPYDELTPCKKCVGMKHCPTASQSMKHESPLSSGYNPHRTHVCSAARGKSHFLTGESGDAFKIRIVITPMSECHE